MKEIPESVREELSYDPLTGVFGWKVGRKGRRETTGSTDVNGYVSITVCGVVYLAHRLAFVLMGEEIAGWEVDHVNRNPSDNRWENLRKVTRVGNCRNQGMYRTNKSGVKGVCYNKAESKWVAYGGRKYLGSYQCFEDAVSARRLWEHAR